MVIFPETASQDSNADGVLTEFTFWKKAAIFLDDIAVQEFESHDPFVHGE